MALTNACGVHGDLVEVYILFSELNLVSREDPSGFRFRVDWQDCRRCSNDCAMVTMVMCSYLKHWSIGMCNGDLGGRSSQSNQLRERYQSTP